MAAPDRSGLPTAEAARAAMLALVTQTPAIEQVPLHVAAGRMLAQMVTAPRDQPVAAVSAMDGYAIRAADLAVDAGFTVAGESAAGTPYGGALGPGQAVRIFTGAVLPEGADAVVMQERAVREGTAVRLPFDVSPGANVRPAAGDFRAGQTLLQPGVRLDPWRLSLAASAGLGTLSVARRPRVAVLSTGEEIVVAGAPLSPHQIAESTGPALWALIAAWGGEAVRLPPAGDDAGAIAAIAAEVEADVLVTIGGASVGDHDLVRPALRSLGLTFAVEGVAMRPGKPTWCGRLPHAPGVQGKLVLGLPGNPASALASAALFLKPLLLALQGAAQPWPALERLRLAAPLPPEGPREHWLRARLAPDAEAMTAVWPLGDQDSSLVTVFAAADVLVRRRAGAPAGAVGDPVEVLRLERL